MTSSNVGDPALQTAVGRDVDMASASTLCRFENSVDAKSLWALSSVLVDAFTGSAHHGPEKICTSLKRAMSGAQIIAHKKIFLWAILGKL